MVFEGRKDDKPLDLGRQGLGKTEFPLPASSEFTEEVMDHLSPGSFEIMTRSPPSSFRDGIPIKGAMEHSLGFA